MVSFTDEDSFSVTINSYLVDNCKKTERQYLSSYLNSFHLW